MKKRYSWKERSEQAHKAYRPYYSPMAVDVARLRLMLFGDKHIPKKAAAITRTIVFNTKGESMGIRIITVKQSKSVGEMKTRGGRGHRLFISCPDCSKEIPVGRLHQHYGYKHSPLTKEEQSEFDKIKGSHQGDDTWARYQVLSKKARGW